MQLNAIIGARQQGLQGQNDQVSICRETTRGETTKARSDSLPFLAHLAQSAKVSFWDDPLSVVRRRRRRRRPSSVVRRQQFT